MLPGAGVTLLGDVHPGAPCGVEGRFPIADFAPLRIDPARAFLRLPPPFAEILWRGKHLPLPVGNHLPGFWKIIFPTLPRFSRFRRFLGGGRRGVCVSIMIPIPILFLFRMNRRNATGNA